MSKLEQGQAALLQRDAAMLEKVEGVEQGQEALRQALQEALTMLAEAVQGVTARVSEVLAYAISEELKQHTNIA